MRAHLTFTLTLVACGAALCAGAAEPEPSRHAPDSPPRLNQLAVSQARGGDLTGAWILLERAALLAPDDERIRQNLRAVRAARDGREPAAEPTAAAVAAAATPDAPKPPVGANDDREPPLPAPWPKK